MKRFLRRVGGIKRLFFGALAFLAIFYAAQTLIFNGSSSHDSSKSDSDQSSNSAANLSTNTIILSNENSNSRSLSNGVSSNNNNPMENKAGLCDVDAVCPQSTLVFTVRSLRSTENNEQMRPQFCLNGQIVSSAPTAPKTVSIAVVDESKHVMEELKHFDVSVDDKDLRDYLLRLAHRSVIFLSSAGDVKDKIKEETKSVLRTQFGARSINSSSSTNSAAASFVFVGQKGLKSNQALEKSEDSNSDVELRGCLQIPMGEIEAAPLALNNPPSGSAASAIKSGQVVRRDSITFGPMVANCGLDKSCPSGEFSVAVYSGKNKDDEPRICVDQRLIMARNLNKAGRGLNALVLNATSRQVLRVGHFDTYAEDSSSLEVFLEEMIDGEMVIVVSFDEASTHFSSMLKQMFYELGSALVQNLKFRASWFIIGQKGISGFSPFEELNFASGNDWAKPVDKKLCIPNFLDGLRVRPDPIVIPKNQAKRHFCEKYDGYEEFCEDERVDDPILPAPLVNRSMNGNPIFKIPILVVSGLAHNSLRLCLETLIHQPGIDPRNVLVTFDENYAESGELAQLFQFKTKSITASASYMTQLAKSLGVLWDEFPDADVAIIIEEELMVTADFLYYMAQMLPVLRSDQNVHSISAWNINAYTDTSTLSNTVYRVEDFPGLAFMMRKTTFTKYMQGKMDECCSMRAWDGWRLMSTTDKKQAALKLITIVPDVSRVIRRHVDGLGIIDENLEEIFHRERAYSKSADAWIANTKYASTEEAYDSNLRQLIDSSIPLNATSVVKECAQRSTAVKQSISSPTITSSKSFFASSVIADFRQSPSNIARNSNSYVVYLDEESMESDDQKSDRPDHDNDRVSPRLERFVRRLRRCFGLYHSVGRLASNPNLKIAGRSGAKSMKSNIDDGGDGKSSSIDRSSPHWTKRGDYKGVLRFSYFGKQMFLIGSSSPFYFEKSNIVNDTRRKKMDDGDRDHQQSGHRHFTKSLAKR